MGLAIFAIIAVGAIAIGIALQALQQQRGFNWLLIAAAVTFGAYFFSATLPTSTVFDEIKDWGPQVDGFYLIPGTLGALVMGALAYFNTATHTLAPRAN